MNDDLISAMDDTAEYAVHHTVTHDVIREVRAPSPLAGLTLHQRRQHELARQAVERAEEAAWRRRMALALESLQAAGWGMQR